MTVHAPKGRKTQKQCQATVRWTVRAVALGKEKNIEERFLSKGFRMGGQMRAEPKTEEVPHVYQSPKVRTSTGRRKMLRKMELTNEMRKKQDVT